MMSTSASNVMMSTSASNVMMSTSANVMMSTSATVMMSTSANVMMSATNCVTTYGENFASVFFLDPPTNVRTPWSNQEQSDASAILKKDIVCVFSIRNANFQFVTIWNCWINETYLQTGWFTA
jgi:hypothetical protein